MNKLTMNDVAALMLVLQNVSAKELLHSAMIGFSNEDNESAQGNADICSQAIMGFLS